MQGWRLTARGGRAAGRGRRGCMQVVVSRTQQAASRKQKLVLRRAAPPGRANPSTSAGPRCPPRDSCLCVRKHRVARAPRADLRPRQTRRLAHKQISPAQPAGDSSPPRPGRSSVRRPPPPLPPPHHHRYPLPTTSPCEHAPPSASHRQPPLVLSVPSMSWRSNAQRSGMNAQPLGAPRRWGGGAASGGPPSSAPAPFDDPAPAPSSKPSRAVERGSAPYMIDGVPSFVSVGAPAGAPGSAPVPGGEPVTQGVKRPRDESAEDRGTFETLYS